MYGDYRKVNQTEENPNQATAAPTAPTAHTYVPYVNNNQRLRGLASISGLTQPLRTKDLLDQLKREGYDDTDESSSKRSARPPEDDPVISWDKHSLPKSLEWMLPTPSKSQSSSAYTVPEILGNHNRALNHPKAGVVSTAECPTSLVNTSNVSAQGDVKNDKVVSNPTPLLDKENIFTPFKGSVNASISRYQRAFSSAQKSLLTDRQCEKEAPSTNCLLMYNSTNKEELFTPLKRSIVPSTSAWGLQSAQKASVTQRVPENAPAEKISPPDKISALSGRKSPNFLSTHPHASLLTPVTPITHMKQTMPTYTKTCGLQVPNASTLVNPLVTSTDLKNHGTAKSELNPLSMPANINVENHCADILSSWMTPAKVNKCVGSDLKAESESGQPSNKSEEEITKSIVENNSKEKDELVPIKSSNKTSHVEERNPPSKIPQSVSKKPLDPLMSIPKPPVNPVPVSTVRSAALDSIEMPPPSLEVRKTVKFSPESVPKGLIHSIGSGALGKRNTNDDLIVNGKSYTILSLLGRGGSSIVYQVLEPGHSKLLAVKCVNLSELDQSIYEGYLNEIRLLSQLQDSDCVIRMYDHQHCTEEKMLYVVMEKGDTDLSKLMRDISSTKKVSPAMAVYYWMEMLKAVSFIHKRGTIHSDLKPANFLLVAGRLKLIDFGIASAIQADMTSVIKDSMTGTCNYISPEAMCSSGSGPDGKGSRYKISYKSDVWSLGCILYNLVYGHTPFQSITNQYMKMAAITNPEHKIPFPDAPGFPRALLQAMQACLVRDPKLRPSIDELLQYPYFGSMERPIHDGLPQLLEQINMLVHSAQSSDDKLIAIQSLLSSTFLSFA